jgi:hypothetical protein
MQTDIYESTNAQMACDLALQFSSQTHNRIHNDSVVIDLVARYLELNPLCLNEKFLSPVSGEVDFEFLQSFSQFMDFHTLGDFSKWFAINLIFKGEN